MAFFPFLRTMVPSCPPQAGEEPTHLTADSRCVQKQSVFAALSRAKQERPQHIAQALEAGATWIVAAPDDYAQFSRETPPASPTILSHRGVQFILTEEPHRFWALLAAAFYGKPPATCVAVTGTNGKSSVVDFTRQIWTLLGKSAASMGTLGVKVGRSPAEARSPLTTPDPVTLHAELSRLAQEEHVECCALEASSHGLDQHRLDGVHLSAAAFTQLSQDHLDYHQTMAAYFDAKKILFETVLPPSGSCVLNADIPECAALHHIASSCGLQVLTYGQHAQSMVLHSLTPEARGQRFHGTILGKEVDWLIPLLGAFQVENVLCAMGLVLASGTPLEELLSLFPSSKELPIQGVPGRLEMLEKAGKTAIIDYAHTPDALEKALRAVRLHTKGRLFLVFGCGGNRDAEKRPLMGNIAEQRSDKVFLTDDNPREEDPAVIRQQMRAGMTGRVPIREIGDRREAIAAALKEANAEDCVLIAGKGHEKTQCVSGKMLPFSDQEVVQEVLG